MRSPRIWFPVALAVLFLAGCPTPGAPVDYVCSGEDGPSILVRTAGEPEGENCRYGGLAVESGLDEDGDGALGDGEVTSASFLCEKREGLLVLQGLEGRYPWQSTSSVTRLERGSRAVRMTVDLGPGPASALALDPDGQSFWVSRQSGSVERRSIETGALQKTVPFPSARDMVLVPSLGRLYVAGHENVGVIDLATSTLMVAIPLDRHDQTWAIDASPAGDEVVLGVYGSPPRLTFIDTATNTVTQDLPVTGYPYDVMHLGSRVVTWDDNADEFRFYDPRPWAEAELDRQTLGDDGGASNNAFHNMIWNPEEGAIYVFRANAAEVVKTSVESPTQRSAFPLAQAYHHLVLDREGGGVEGVRWPANTATSFEHLAMPAGNTSASSWNASGLPGAEVIVHLVPFTLE